MNELQSPNQLRIENIHDALVFLAGSIEMGKAENWQKNLIHEFRDDEDVTFLNPRRDDWDSSWKQSRDDPRFVQQVQWELDGIDSVDIVFFYFDPNTMAPVSMAELGYVLGGVSHGERDPYQIVVVCPDGFWRQGNVDIMCDRVGVTVHRTLEEGYDSLTAIIQSY